MDKEKLIIKVEMTPHLLSTWIQTKSRIGGVKQQVFLGECRVNYHFRCFLFGLNCAISREWALLLLRGGSDRHPVGEGTHHRLNPSTAQTLEVETGHKAVKLTL